jgi:hypothetical protein
MEADEADDDGGGGALDGGEGAQDSSSVGSTAGMGVWSLVSSSKVGAWAAAGMRASEGSGWVATRMRLSERRANGSLSGWASKRPESRAERGTGTACDEIGLCEMGGEEGGEGIPGAGARFDGTGGRGVGEPLPGGDEWGADEPGLWLGGLACGAVTAV